MCGIVYCFENDIAVFVCAVFVDADSCDICVFKVNIKNRTAFPKSHKWENKEIRENSQAKKSNNNSLVTTQSQIPLTPSQGL